MKHRLRNTNLCITLAATKFRSLITLNVSFFAIQTAFKDFCFVAKISQNKNSKIFLIGSRSFITLRRTETHETPHSPSMEILNEK